MDKEEKKNRKNIKKMLASQLGVDVDDINDDDSLREDLHMNPVDLTDFNQKLISSRLDTEEIDFTQIETLSDLYEALI